MEISEALALIIAGGAGAACMSFFYAKEDFSHFHLTGWNPFQSDIVTAVERLGLTPDIHETTGAKTAEKALEERVEEASRSHGSRTTACSPAGRGRPAAATTWWS